MSFPLLLDRAVDFIAAMIASVRAVVSNPAAMLGWALCVVLMLFTAPPPAFLSLVVVLPVLGHTTWHLHRRLVGQGSAPHPDRSRAKPVVRERCFLEGKVIENDMPGLEVSG